jgi:SAM-dependent methyltransferase
MAVADPALLRDIFQWEVRTWSRALRLWEPALEGRPAGTALAIGERDGGLSLWLALKGIAVRCTDLKPLPGTTAVLHQRHGVAHLVSYGSEDATALSAPDASYDIVVFKSVIGALGDRSRQRTAIAEMHRVLKPGGVLLFAENLTGTALHGMLRKRFVQWSSYWRYLVWSADQDLFQPFASMRTMTTGLLANLGRSETQRDLLARADAVLCPMVPKSWHCVVIGVCTKGR